MGSFIDLLRWESRTEKEKREKEYYAKMFPFGEEQKEHDKELLKELVRANVKENEKLYQLLVVREALQETDAELQRRHLENWYNNRLMKRYSPTDIAVIYAIAQIELQSATLEELAQKETILEQAEQIREEVLPHLKKQKKPFHF